MRSILIQLNRYTLCFYITDFYKFIQYYDSAFTNSSYFVIAAPCLSFFNRKGCFLTAAHYRKILLDSLALCAKTNKTAKDKE